MPTHPSDSTSVSKTVFHLLLLVLLGLGLGCKSPLSDEPSASPGAETVTVSFSIGSSDLLAASQGTGASARVSGLGFSFQDVASVRIDVLVREADGSTSPLFRDVPLAQGTNGPWTGRLPFLPRNKPLSFVATASSASGAELFRGSTDQTLTEDNTAVSIVLAPVTDGAHITLPRLQRITVPAELFPEQSFPLRFLVEARADERLDYAIEEGASGAAGGTFSPSQGSIQLEGSTATVVIHYTAPTVGSATDFTHSIRLTNRDGHSVSTTFRIRVRPPSSDGVRDTSVAVRFNPVINALSAVRVPGAPQVALEASVSDDRPLSELSYAWSLTADDPGTSPTFSSQANPTLLQGYTLELSGTLRLEVKDAQGGTTTLRYVVPPHQFPDNPTQDTGFTSLLAGEGHTCTLLDTGKVRCWGLNAHGQLGHGHTHDLGDDEPLSTVGDVPLAESASQLAVGGHHTCALLEGGAVRCWGRNDSGQLGYGHTLALGDDEGPSSSGYVPFGGRAVELVAGSAHTCALLDTGQVRCWGHNAHGQLGLGHTRSIGDDESPASAGDVDVGGPVRHLIAGAWHTCALLQTGAVRCWGRNDSGQLGQGNTLPIGDDESPASVGELSLGGPVLQLAAHGTSQHTCARLESGDVRCWGRNAHGQLGQGHTLPIGDNETPASVGIVTTGGIALQLATGAEHTCALLSPGVLQCWGRNESGQLGLGNTASLSTPPTTRVDLGGAMAFQLAAGAWHTCALTSSGEPRCWGRNTHGQLGLGNTYNLGDNEPPSGEALTTPMPPQLVETFQSAATVGSGGSVSFLVQAMDPQASGLSFSWTANTGTRSTATTTPDTSQVSWTAPSCVPWGTTPTLTVTVSNALGVSSSHSFIVTGVSLCVNQEATVLACGNSHSSALKQDGTVWAWGTNTFGQLGDGTTTTRHSPVRVPGLDGVTAIAAGFFHTLALRQEGTVWAWGQNTYGQLGDGTTTHRATPAPVWSLGGITAIAGGGYHGLALHQDGTVWSWGYNFNGQLGDGTTTFRHTPVKVPVLDGVTALAGGYSHTLALRQDGTVWAWGQNTYGQLGLGAGGSNRLSPVQVPNLTGVTALAAGDYYSLALRQDGTVWAWGANDRGQLGDGTTTGRVSPKQVQDLGGIVSLAAGQRHTVALSQDGTVWVWGQNYVGQLGDGTRFDRYSPVPLWGLSGITAIDAGANHSLALRQDGTVWAWGLNGGQLGNGTTITPSSPVQVTAF